MVDAGAMKERASRSRYASFVIDPCEDIALSCHERSDALIAIAKGRAAHGSTEAVESAFRLLSEAAIRDRIPQDDPAVHEITEQLRIRRHPMSWIPLWPIDLEQNLRTWSLNRNKGGSIPAFEVRTSRPVRGRSTHLALADRPINVEQHYRDLFDRLAPTNFRAEAWLGTCDSPIDSDLAAANALQARIPDKDAESKSVEPSGTALISATDAVAAVLDPVVNGGAYNHGAGAAYGRLVGWRALASLVGAHDGLPFDQVALAVRNSTWLWLPTTSHWFYQVSWDGFVGCIGPTRRSLAGLAWTDTD